MSVAELVAPEEIAALLGLRRLNVRSEADLDGAVRKGLPVAAVSSLHRLGYSIAEIAQVLATSPRTINRLLAPRPQNPRLNLAMSDRAVRMATITLLAERLLGDRGRGVRWLRMPNTYLGGAAPLAMIDTDLGTSLVAQSLHAIAFGGSG